MKQILLLFFLIPVNILVAQKRELDNMLYQNYKYENDSLVLLDGIPSDEFSLVNIRKEFIYDYYCQAFTKLDNGDYSKLKHWSVPIKIYLDKSIDKTIREDFTQFVKFLPKIERLSVSIVSNKNDANYYVGPVTKHIAAYDDDFYTGITFSLLTDSSDKFYGGKLIFNPKQLKNDTDIKTKLRQYFFASLGSFGFWDEFEENSLLSKDYVNTRTISKYDYTFLYRHYTLYNKNPIGNPELNKLLEKIHTTTFTNVNGRLNLKL
ncbi:hypothetical protein [Flavobacterium limnosediminis]|uniref:hypothetical protein n=1 Tax=Flavobacterium limnosediminis TaxID=1401027 RepID=UPI000415FE04|nr:hypothetical protein [Flavobacterium limnosediminis]